MPYHHMKNSFVRGEITAKLMARQDWDGWKDAAHCLENAVVQVQGGAARRAGSAFIAQAKDSLHPVCLQDFVYSEGVAYGLELGHTYMRFYRDRALLRTADTEPTGTLTLSALTGVVTVTTGVSVFTSTVVDRDREITLLSGGLLRIVTVTDATTATADVLADADSVGPHAAGAWRITGTPVEVSTPYQDAEVFEVQCDAQSADVLYFCHPDYPVYKLSRLTETSFTFFPVDFNPEPIDEAVLYPTTTLTLSATTGTGVTATTADAFFLTGDVGREIRAVGGRAIIVSITDATTATVDIFDPFQTTTLLAGDWRLLGSPHAWLQVLDNTAGNYTVAVLYDAFEWGNFVPGFRDTDVGHYISAWGGVMQIMELTTNYAANVRIVAQLTELKQLPSWFDPTVLVWNRAVPGAWTIDEEMWPAVAGYPSCAEFTQDRLAFGGSYIWMSRTGDYECFAGGVLDNTSITVPVPGQDPVLWLKDSDALVVGTAAREVAILGGSDRVFTPDSSHTETKGRYGSDDVQPIVSGSDLLFVPQGGRGLRMLAPAPDTDQWWAPSISTIAEHLFRQPITQLAHLRVPDSVLLAVRSDGVLLTNTFERPEKVTTAWAHQITLGNYQSACVLPHPQGEEILVLVEREIGGQMLKYVEVFDGSLNLDSALIYTGDGVEEIRGLRHLEGQSVTFKVNWTTDATGQTTGGTAYSGTVANGTLALGTSATSVEVGLAYASKWIPVEPDVPTQGGSIQGRRTRWSELIVRWYCTEGSPTINGETWRLPEEATTPYTGDTRCTELGWSRLHGKPTCLIEQATPFSATVLGVMGALTVDDA